MISSNVLFILGGFLSFYRTLSLAEDLETTS